MRVMHSADTSVSWTCPSLAHLVGWAVGTAWGAAALRSGFPSTVSFDTAERAWLKAAQPVPARSIQEARSAVLAGRDVWGETYCRLKTPVARREHGATFTPDAIVGAMIDWAADRIVPSAVVDPGAGSGRYTWAAAQRFPRARLVAVEQDPLLRILLKASRRILGLEKRLSVVSGSFLDWAPPVAPAGPILYVGNPPYVRHHQIDSRDKEAYRSRCGRLGVPGSALAGLHVHFATKILEDARPGDVLSFITASEWLSTNYGQGLRAALASGKHDASLTVFPKEARVFEDALASAVVVGVRFGVPSATVRLDFPSEYAPVLGRGRDVVTERLSGPEAWGPGCFRTATAPVSVLGDRFKVGRGVVTGQNDVWLVGPETPPLPERFLRPCVSRAEDLTSLSGGCLVDARPLRRLVVLPENLGDASPAERRQIEAFLAWARARGADATHTARHRKCWWRVDVRPAPPLIMTYMGRRPPVFVRNEVGALILNIAHGLRPLATMTAKEQDGWVRWLNKNVSVEQGRAYAGGLVKFEPKEAMRIPIPPRPPFSPKASSV